MKYKLLPLLGIEPRHITLERECCQRDHLGIHENNKDKIIFVCLFDLVRGVREIRPSPLSLAIPDHSLAQSLLLLSKK